MAENYAPLIAITLIEALSSTAAAMALSMTIKILKEYLAFYSIVAVYVPPARPIMLLPPPPAAAREADRDRVDFRFEKPSRPTP